MTSIQTFQDSLESKLNLIHHKSEAGEFNISVADYKQPLWFGTHNSGGKLAIYRGKVSGSTSYPLVVYIYVLYFSTSTVDAEALVGYKIYKSDYNPDLMITDLMSTVQSKLLYVIEEQKAEKIENGNYNLQ